MTDFLRFPYKVFRPIYERTSFHRSVIDEVEDPDLKEAYAYCRSMTRHHAKTFYMATRFLPNDKQRSIFAIYALCRYIDDLVDETGTESEGEYLHPDKTREQLNRWQEKLEEAYEGKIHDNPILLAFSNVLRTYSIPMNLPVELMEGVCMDLYKNRYRTFDELYDYSYKVASTVGLMTCEVFGYNTPQALRHAEELGIAMQMTNILRDVGEDLERNRIYLPTEELERFGVTEQDLFNRKLNDNLRQFMEFFVQRTRFYYQRAERGIGMLAEDSRIPVYLAHINYSRIMNKIEENGYNVFAKRAYLNATEKLTILPRVYYRLYNSSARFQL